MVRQSRRTLLGVLAGSGIGALAGCSSLDVGPLGTSAGSETERTPTWRSRRGTPANTGLSSSGGPDGDPTEAFTATLRDGHLADSLAPVVGENAVYTVSGPATPYESEPIKFPCYVYAFSRSDGSELWRTTVETYEGGSNGKFPRDTSLCLGPESLYVCWIREENELPVAVARLSPDDGSEQWRKELSPTGGSVRQPVVRDGHLYLFSSRRMTVFDTESGETLWQRAKLDPDQPVPAVGPDSVAVYHVGEDQPRTLSVFETADQSVRWEKEFDSTARPIPTLSGDTLFLTDGYRPFAYVGKALNDATERPKRKILALSLEDGSEQWTHTYDTDEIHSSATVGGTRTVTVTDDHVYYALGFQPASELIATTAPDSRLEAVREKLYRGPNVVALNRSDGSVAWKTTVGSQARVFQPMVAGPDNLYALYRGLEAENEQSQVWIIDRENGDVRDSIPVQTDWPIGVADGTLYTHRMQEILAFE